jgi:hypothetical protein
VDLRRLRIGEWIAGVSGVVLLVALFLDWYSLEPPGGGGENAWATYTVSDVLLAIAALFGVALAVAAATQRSPAVPQAIGALTVPWAVAGAVLLLIKLLSLPDGADGREIGFWLGLAGTFGVLVGSWWSISDQSFPRAVATKLEVTPLPAPKPRSEPSGDDE